jgi:tetratricopeptide (TPR) repeat protein
MLGKLPGGISHCAFENFGQARNYALMMAEHSGFRYDYLLLIDADMELVVKDLTCFDNLTADAYMLTQKNGSLTYRNTRLLRRGSGARYIGVTHEYLNLPGTALPLDGAWFIDHADGANRDGKFQRDVRLLEVDLQRDPDNARSWFYLAQSKKDLGNFAEAAKLYEKRALMGGWDEEVFESWLQASRCARQIE